MSKTEILTKLIEELFSSCAVCQGSGRKTDSEGQYFTDEKEPCIYCDGTGEVLCFEAELLRQILKDGRR